MNEKKKSILLFCGSFNPIHNGHTAVAKAAANAGYAHINFLVAGQSPFKQKSNAANFNHRVAMCKIAAKHLNKNFHPNKTKNSSNNLVQKKEVNNKKVISNSTEIFKVNTLEGKLPTPSYTARTLKHLTTKNKAYYILLLGEDNLLSLPKWKESAFIIENFEILVYPRKQRTAKHNSLTEFITGLKQKHKVKKIAILQQPYLAYSATQVRESLKSCEDVSKLLLASVTNYIKRYGVY